MFPSNENFCEKSIGFRPRGDYFVRRSRAKDLANRSEQVFANNGIVLGQDAQGGVLLRDKFDRSAENLQVVDIGGISADRRRQGLLLRTCSLVSGIKRGATSGLCANILL
jgi:hypothetical protein